MTSSVRVFSGLLAGGLVVLFLALLVASFVAGRTGTSGPGTATLAWHGVAAIAAVLAQRHADRHRGATGTAAALAVVAVTAVLLDTQWLF